MWKSLGMVAVSCATATGVFAETVLLKSLDGRMSVTGAVIGHDGGTATIRSELGVVNVPIDLMSCTGAACEGDIAWAEVISTVEPKPITVAVNSGQEREILHVLSDRLDADPQFNVVSSPLDAAIETLTIDSDRDGKTVSFQVKDGAEEASVRFVSVAEAKTAATGLEVDAQPLTQLVGLSAFHVIAHEDVKIDAISMEQLSQIYAGDITNWAELGGADQEIVALKREPKSMAAKDFEALVMTPHARALGADILTVSGDEKLAKYVNSFVGAVGVVDASFVKNGNIIPVRSACGAYQTATQFAVASGDYPLARPLFAVHQESHDDAMVALFDEATTDLAQAAMAGYGLLDTKISEEQTKAKSDRLEAMMQTDWPDAQMPAAKDLAQLLLVSNRLSSTFRAGELTTGDAAWNRRQMLQLADLMASGAYAGHELVFAGFAEGTASRGATKAAAAEVMAAFKSTVGRVIGGGQRPSKVEAVGFGALKTDDCAVSAIAQNETIRIEVWVRDAAISG